jgi:hypothetical protein
LSTYYENHRLLECDAVYLFSRTSRCLGSGITGRYSSGLRDGGPGFDSRQGKEIFLYSTASRATLGPTQPPIQWVPGALSPGVKRPRCEADHSPPSSAEVKRGGDISLLTVCLHGVVLNYLSA